MERVPLAERMRPKKLADIVGQAHLLGKNEILQQIVKLAETVDITFMISGGCGLQALASMVTTR